MDFSVLPSINAGLNATSAVFLVMGYVFIRTGRRDAHRACMLVSVTMSTLFLISYLTYHYTAGATPFAGQGWIRPVYFAILGTHTLLAVAVVPLVTVTLIRALRERFTLHRQIARWTFPIWLYVSVTGVVIYWLLYHAYPA